MHFVFFKLNLLYALDSNGTYYVIFPTCYNHCIPCLMCVKVIYSFYMKMCCMLPYFDKEADFKISSKLIHDRLQRDNYIIIVQAFISFWPFSPWPLNQTWDYIRPAVIKETSHTIYNLWRQRQFWWQLITHKALLHFMK